MPMKIKKANPYSMHYNYYDRVPEWQVQPNSIMLNFKQMNVMKNVNEKIADMELQQLKEFTEELHEAGLIDKKKGCIIEWKKEGHLYINNKKQQSEISDKYSRYYNKDGYVIKLNCDNGNAASP